MQEKSINKQLNKNNKHLNSVWTCLSYVKARGSNSEKHLKNLFIRFDVEVWKKILDDNLKKMYIVNVLNLAAFISIINCKVWKATNNLLLAKKSKFNFFHILKVMQFIEKSGKRRQQPKVGREWEREKWKKTAFAFVPRKKPACVFLACYSR